MRFGAGMAMVLMLELVTRGSAMAGGYHEFSSFSYGDKVRVAASSTVVADIAAWVGGNKVSIVSLAKGTQDVRDIKVCQSMIEAAHEADMLLRLGMGCDPWTDESLERTPKRVAHFGRESHVSERDVFSSDSGGQPPLGAQNGRIAPGAGGCVDCSQSVHKLDTAAGATVSKTRCEYYWLDPVNGKTIAANILAGLIRVSPKNSAYFNKRYASFCDRIDASMPRWQAMLAPFKGTNFIALGGDWSYFANRFQLRQAERVSFTLTEKPHDATGAEVVLFEQSPGHGAELESVRRTNPRVLLYPVCQGKRKA